jgi:hypothetical protein
MKAKKIKSGVYEYMGFTLENWSNRDDRIWVALKGKDVIHHHYTKRQLIERINYYEGKNNEVA